MLTASVRERWFAYRQPAVDARLRLFCFPYAGGGASVFRTWVGRLPAVDIWPVQYPGRENRLSESACTRLDDLVGQLAGVIQPCLDLPFAFFGHSLGGLVGFELARRLRREGSPAPEHVFVSGRRAPHQPDRGAPIHALPDAEFVEALRRLNGTPEGVLQNAELMQLMTPTLRADFALVETYRYAGDQPLDCPLSAFGGRADDRVSEEDIAAWWQHTTGVFQMRMVPGDHFFIHSARDRLLEAVGQDLSRIK